MNINMKWKLYVKLDEKFIKQKEGKTDESRAKKKSTSGRV